MNGYSRLLEFGENRPLRSWRSATYDYILLTPK